MINELKIIMVTKLLQYNRNKTLGYVVMGCHFGMVTETLLCVRLHNVILYYFLVLCLSKNKSTRTNINNSLISILSADYWPINY